jgi:hypothetical protein
MAHAIEVAGVEQGYSRLDRGSDGGDAFGFLGLPVNARRHPHAAEAQRADGGSVTTELGCVHACTVSLINRENGQSHCLRGGPVQINKLGRLIDIDSARTGLRLKQISWAVLARKFGSHICDTRYDRCNIALPSTPDDAIFAQIHGRPA